MRVAFDLDGVLADLHAEFARTALRLFPELDARTVTSPEVGSSPPEDVAGEEPGQEPGSESGADAMPDPTLSTLALLRRQTDAVWRQLGATENFWENLAEIEAGAIARLFSLAEARRWEVLFITSRPTSAGRTVQRQSQRWLEKLGFPLPSLYVVQGSRGRIAEALALDVVVDDRPENCLDVVLESKAGAVLVWRSTRASVPASAKRLGIAVVNTVNAAIDAIDAAERQGGTDRMLDRLRHLFGLRTKPASGLLRS
jgi:hypothetical protein